MSIGLRTLRVYTTYWRRHPFLFMGALGMGPAYILQAVAFPLFLAKALGQLINHVPVNSSYLWLAGLSLLGGAIISYFADHYCNMRLTTLATTDLYNTNLQHLMRQEYGFFADTFGGSLVAQANRFAKSYETFSNVVFLDTLGLLSGVLASLAVMVYYSAPIGLLAAGLWLVSIAVIVALGIRRMPIRRRAVALESQQTGELADIVSNAITVKTFAQETTERARYSAINTLRAAGFHRSWSVAVRNELAISLMCAVLQLTVFIGGIQAVLHGALSIATFLLFQLYIVRVITSLQQAITTVRMFEGLLGDAHEMTELLERTPALQDPLDPERCRITAGAITLQDVSFDYAKQAGKKAALLNHFNLDIKPGEKIGLVGPSGGGKTTLTKLLLRFVDVQGGAILLDGQDIRNITQHDLHQHIAYVPQEPLLFHRSIKENIRYGNPKASDAEVIRVAKLAHAHEFITHLPGGYDTLVGERGIKLSGGQRQRIAIARAMIVTGAPILVLDEATSALDSESEQYIQDSLWRLMQDKTAIVIAHRLSTIQKMDRIIVLNEGNIVEEGNHKQLLKQQGLYAKLWSHQSGGFIEE